MIVTEYGPADFEHVTLKTSAQSLSLAEIRNGTGFPRGQRFVTLEDHERLLAAADEACPHEHCRYCEELDE